MLAKLTRGNQVTIPKGIIQKAHLKEGNDYVDVEYANGIIYLKPVEVEERIPPETFEKFAGAVRRQQPGDVKAAKEETSEDILRRWKKRR
jgi:AbrB family looped-hinge helix DNA binding protein